MFVYRIWNILRLYSIESLSTKIIVIEIVIIINILRKIKYMWKILYSHIKNDLYFSHSKLPWGVIFIIKRAELYYNSVF